MSDNSFPEPLQWNGDEPDPYAEADPDERCDYCGEPSGARGCRCDDYDEPEEEPA